MSEKKHDVFAEIARKGMDFAGKNLYIPQPPEKEEADLPYGTDDRYAAVYPKKMDTKEELYEALEKARLTYAPFLEDHAPKMQGYRHRQYLTEMDYRLRTAEDDRDFISVLLGEGEWETVKIPHYWGPLGEQKAFYRTEFSLEAGELDAQKRQFVCFKAVDYKAHVFMNGNFLGSHEGFFAPFEFDFTHCAKAGENTLVVVVENDFITGNIGDKIYAATGLGYDDPAVGWHHCPPGFGICQDCYIETRPVLFLRDIFVRPMIDGGKAEVKFEVYQAENTERDLTYAISVYGQNFKQTVFEREVYRPASVIECGMGDTLTVAKRIASGEYGASFALPTCYRINTFTYSFEIPEQRLWEPDLPYLYQIQIEVLDESGHVIDGMKRQFGMRSFTQDTDGAPKGMFYLNHKPVRLRGANTMGHEQQCVFHKDFDQLIDDILLAKLANMNFWRITQRPVQEEVYDYCDRLGLMTQCDLPLFGALRRNQFYEGIRQAGEMERLVRSHPCGILTSYINEPFPNANNHEQLSLTRKELEDFFAACDIAVLHQNPDRVIKPIDGDYDPPGPGLPDNHCYPMWYNGHGIDIGRLNKGYWMPVKPGWYYGCGEYGAEGLDPVSVMKKHYPQDWLPQSEAEEKGWSPNQIVNAQTGMFHYFFYETPETLHDWVEKSQAHQAVATKLMTEAFRRDPRMITFAIHLFIDAFPSGWMKTIMDVERSPKPAYFAYRDALTPLMVSLRADRFKYFAGDEIVIEPWICNDTENCPDAYLQYQVMDEKQNALLSGRQKARISPNSTEFQGYLRFIAPKTEDRAGYTVYASILSLEGEVLHFNAMQIEVLNRQESRLPENIQICGGGQKTGELLAELGESAKDINFACADVILIDDFNAYAQNRKEIDAAVQNGAKVIFLELGEGDYAVADTQIQVKMCSMMPLHFVSRDTGHALVKDFLPDDFRHWYSKKEDYICPILEYTFVSDQFTPVLTSGNTDENSRWTKALAVGEYKYGGGSFYVCQLKLAGNIEKNPIAQRFAQGLL